MLIPLSYAKLTDCFRRIQVKWKPFNFFLKYPWRVVYDTSPGLIYSYAEIFRLIIANGKMAHSDLRVVH